MSLSIQQSGNDENSLSLYIDLIDVLHKKNPLREEYKLDIAYLMDAGNPFFRHGMARHFFLLEDGVPAGHVLAIIDSRLAGIGFLGFFDCINDRDACSVLLETASGFLSAKGCSIIRGPVNLSIWHGYRFTEQHKRPITIFDPVNHDYYPSLWTESGFFRVEEYVSAVRKDYNYVLPFTKNDYEKNISMGFSIRKFNENKIPEELRIIHELSSKIFAGSWSFFPITYEEFAYIYKGHLAKIDKRRINVIEDKNGLAVGFCFAFPNPQIKGQFIFKTIGVLPEFQRMKLAASMLYATHIRAKEDGFNELYYPLIRSGNSVTKFPYEGYDIITHYSSFEKVLKKHA